MVASPDAKLKGLLKINWFSHLGFNNVRFILEMVVVLGQMLGRRVLAPSTLRMRVCTDESMCSKAGCIKKKDKEQLWWCPTVRFLDGKALQSVGVVLPKDEDNYLRNKAIKTAKGAFESFYDNTNLWLDAVPAEARSSPDGTIDGNARFQFWSYHLGCELSYFRQKKDNWSPRRKEKRIFDFAKEYGSLTDEVLYLAGTPHNIGHTPIQWSTREGIQAAQSVWERGVVYNPIITKMAEAISKQLVSMSSTGSYVCVHLRRGDFVKAGWLGKAADLSFVSANIERRLQQGEALYISTDEQSENDRNMFRKMGAKFFDDFRTTVQDTEAFGEDYVNMLGFEDYVGLVEQSVCASRGARKFMGSKCSSFTGNILNLRRRYLGDDSETYVISESDK